MTAEPEASQRFADDLAAHISKSLPEPLIALVAQEPPAVNWQGENFPADFDFDRDTWNGSRVAQKPPAPTVQDLAQLRQTPAPGGAHEPADRPRVGFMVMAVTARGSMESVGSIWPDIEPCENHLAYCEGMAVRNHADKGWPAQQYRIVEVREVQS